MFLVEMCFFFGKSCTSLFSRNQSIRHGAATWNYVVSDICLFFEKPPIPKPPTKSIAVLVRNPELNCYLPLLPLDPKTMKNRGFTPPKVAPWYWAGA